MKKAMYVAAAALLFSGCYNEVELEPRKAGDVLPIAGAYNVRDAGGYAGADGKRVKSGKLIRSGDLNMLTKRDQDYLFGEMGVKTVVDFRSKVLIANEDLTTSPSEQQSSLDRLPDGVTHLSDTGILESVVVPDYESILSNSSQYPDVESVINAVKKGYKRIVGFPEGGDTNTAHAKAQYKAFFNILLNSNGDPVLYHCSAGKDRTGVATMLLLSALGVDKETIINDYLLSEGYVEEKYYPVAPYVVKATIASMKERRQLGKTLRGNYGEPAKQQAEESLNESIRKKVIQGTMQSQLNLGQSEAQAKAAALDAYQYGNLNSRISDNQASAKAGMEQLAIMTDEQIEQYAQETGEKVKPLLTVRREYIEATFSAIEAAYSTSNTPVLDYLKDQNNGLGLTQGNINTLKALYLE